MPKFTIESTFDVPHYRHTTYEADTFEQACAMALADEEWDRQEKDYDSSSPTRLTGAWEGEHSAYSGPSIALPAPPEPDFDPSTLSDNDLTRCLYEIRKRGASAAVYDADELATMFDGDDENSDVDFDALMIDNRADLEESMCEAARHFVLAIAGDYPHHRVRIIEPE